MTSARLPEKLQHIQRIRDAVPLPATIGELYNGQGKLRSEFIEHRPAEHAIQRYHKRTGETLRDSDLPVGLQQALHLPLVWVQIVNRYPWKVMWIRRTPDGKRRKGQKLCASLGHAVAVREKVSKVAPNATVVSRVRGYDIPTSLRGKLPPRWYWCPRCMKPRRYVRDEKGETFTALKKVWSKEKQRFRWVERPVYLLRCPMCECTNRDPIFRRSNQPWETRKFKRGVTRARRTKKRR
jgi:hypothetical protein